MQLTRNQATGLVSSARYFLPTVPGIGAINDAFTYNPHAELMTSATNVENANAELHQFSLTRDNAGRIASRSERVMGVASTNVYSYDTVGRLSSASRNGTTTTYTYDDNSNRLTRSDGTTLTSSTFNSRDQLLTSGEYTYAYNNNGARISKVRTSHGEITYYYDVFGNLIGVSLPNGTQIDYVLDGLQRRIAKKVNGIVKEGYSYLDELRVAARFDIGPTPKLNEVFVYPNNQNVPELMLSQGVFYRAIVDERGTTKLVINTVTGAVAQKVETDEFGRVLSDTRPGFFPFKFAGCLYDEDTKLCHFGAREYDPEVGRWLQRDPILFEGGDFNLYGYTLNDPVNFVDPDGKNAVCIGKIIGKVASLKFAIHLAQQRLSEIERILGPALHSDPSAVNCPTGDGAVSVNQPALERQRKIRESLLTMRTQHLNEISGYQKEIESLGPANWIKICHPDGSDDGWI